MSQPRPKEDEEDDEEEQGEEFVFDDSTDEEKPEEDSKGISLDCVSSVQVSKKEDSGTSGNVSQTITDGTKLPETLPPAGQEGISTEVKASISPAGEIFSGIFFQVYQSHIVWFKTSLK